MDINLALRIVIARTNHCRYGDLCNPDHPDYNPDYVPIVIAMALDLPPPTREEKPRIALGVSQARR